MSYCRQKKQKLCHMCDGNVAELYRSHLPASRQQIIIISSSSSSGSGGYGSCLTLTRAVVTHRAWCILTVLSHHQLTAMPHVIKTLDDRRRQSHRRALGWRRAVLLDRRCWNHRRTHQLHHVASTSTCVLRPLSRTTVVNSSTDMSTYESPRRLSYHPALTSSVELRLSGRIASRSLYQHVSNICSLQNAASDQWPNCIELQRNVMPID